MLNPFRPLFSRANARSTCKRLQRYRRLRFEALESRRLLAAEVKWLESSGTLIVNGDFNTTSEFDDHISIEAEEVGGKKYVVVKDYGDEIFDSDDGVETSDVTKITVNSKLGNDFVSLNGVSEANGYVKFQLDGDITIDGNKGTDTLRQ